MISGRDPICFVISSPSGAGKTTLVEKILKADRKIKKTVSYTTRVRRPKERNGSHYHFVSHQSFEEMKNAGEFLEWARVYDNFYGTSKAEIERILNKSMDAVLVIENQGAKAIKSLFPRSVFVLILPPSLHELKKRIKKRLHTDDDFEKRFNNAKKEIEDLLWFDYVIVNQKLSTSVALLRSIIAAERSKLSKDHTPTLR